MEDFLKLPLLGAVKVEQDEGLASFDFDFFPSDDAWGLPHDFDSAGGDSGFSSPQDSPRDDWFADFSDSVDETPNRTRLLSLSLPTDLPNCLLPSMEAGNGAMDLSAIDLPCIGPMVDAPLFLDLNLADIKLEGLPSLDLLNLPDLSGLNTSVTEPTSDNSGKAGTVSATAPTAPSSPRQQGSIDPCVLTQFEDDDVEIDVVGDGTDSFDSISVCGDGPASPASTQVCSLTRENSAMSSVSDLSAISSMSTASTISSLSSLSSPSSTSLAGLTTRPSSPTLANLMQSSAAGSSDLTNPASALSTPTLSSTAANVTRPTTGANIATQQQQQQQQQQGLHPHTFPGIPPLHTGVGVPPLHMHLPGLPPLSSMHAHLGMGGPTGAGSKSSSNSRAGPYPKRNSERKRHLHNELERKRREDLNLTFFRLGDLLPNLKASTSQPTQVHILQGAADHIKELKEKQTQLTSTKATLQAENQKLQERLRELQALCMTN